jgi:hypothetical protein
MTNQVTLTIDGQQVTVPAGIGVVDAAKMVGIDIPVFCHHPKLEPVGMCRMCLVEIGRPMRDRATGQIVMENGAPKIQFLPKLETACTNKVEEGMVVLTQTEKARMDNAALSSFCSPRTHWIARSAIRAASVLCRILRWRMAQARAASYSMRNCDSENACLSGI